MRKWVIIKYFCWHSSPFSRHKADFATMLIIFSPALPFAISYIISFSSMNNSRTINFPPCQTIFSSRKTFWAPLASIFPTRPRFSHQVQKSYCMPLHFHIDSKPHFSYAGIWWPLLDVFRYNLMFEFNQLHIFNSTSINQIHAKFHCKSFTQRESNFFCRKIGTKCGIVYPTWILCT